MSRLYPEITPGSYWICKINSYSFGIRPHDIFAKVLSVNEDDIHFIKKTEYGFKDEPPATLKAETFLMYYQRLED